MVQLVSSLLMRGRLARPTFQHRLLTPLSWAGTCGVWSTAPLRPDGGQRKVTLSLPSGRHAPAWQVLRGHTKGLSLLGLLQKYLRQGLKPQTFVFSWFRRLGIQDQGVSQVGSFRGPLWWGLFWASLACREGCLPTVFPLSVSVSKRLHLWRILVTLD